MSGVNAVEITDGDGARNALQRAGETAETCMAIWEELERGLKLKSIGEFRNYNERVFS